MQNITKKRNGVAIIICMAFLAIFTALAVGMIGMADTNVQLARNQHNGSLAFTSAQSGLEVMRYWLAKVDIDGSVAPNNRLQTVASNINSLPGVNISAIYDNSDNAVTIQPVMLDTATGQNFRAKLYTINDNKQMRAQIIGSGDQASKQVVVDYNFVTNGKGVFNFGVATKGPLNMSGQADIEGETIDLNIDASVYIEGDNTASDAFSSTVQANVAGDVSVANPYATVTVNGKVGGVIAGDGTLDNVNSSLKFAGQVVSHDVSTLTGSQYDAIKTQTGTFICAPGFSLDFSGQALYMNGAIAASGVKLSGQALGVINGSLINYSSTPMTMSGKSTLKFNRSGRDKVPAGFEPDQKLVFIPSSYSESL